MINSEALDIVLECIESGGGEHARLAQAAAQDLARAACPRDQFAATDEYRARRRAQAFGQAARHGIEAGAKRLHRGLEMHRGVEDARAIEMRGEAAAARQRQRLLEIGAADRTATDGVLEREQARAREV